MSRPLTRTVRADTPGNDFVKLDYGVTKLTSLITPNISNELLYQYGRELDYEDPAAFTPYTKANLITTTAAMPERCSGYTPRASTVGSPYYSPPPIPMSGSGRSATILYWSKGNVTTSSSAWTMVHNYDLTNQSQYYEGKFTYSLNFAQTTSADLYSKGSTDGRDLQRHYLPALHGATSTVNRPPVEGTIPATPATDNRSYGTSNLWTLATMDMGVLRPGRLEGVAPRHPSQLGLRYDS